MSIHVTSSIHLHVTFVHTCHVTSVHSCHIIISLAFHIRSLTFHISPPLTSHHPSIQMSHCLSAPIITHSNHTSGPPPPPSPSPSPLGTIVLRYFGRPYISASPAYKQYLCLFCKDIPHQPCTLKCCGKVSCRDCGKGPGTCPGCGGRVITVTDTPLERRIKEVRVFCPNAGRGCYQLRSMSLMDVMQHR